MFTYHTPSMPGLRFPTPRRLPGTSLPFQLGGAKPRELWMTGKMMCRIENYRCRMDVGGGWVCYYCIPSVGTSYCDSIVRPNMENAPSACLRAVAAM